MKTDVADRGCRALQHHQPRHPVPLLRGLLHPVELNLKEAIVRSRGELIRKDHTEHRLRLLTLPLQQEPQRGRRNRNQGEPFGGNGGRTGWLAYRVSQ